MENINKLTRMQQDHMNNDFYKREREKFHKSWFNEDTIDFWLHDFMYSTISPIAKFYKQSNWLSVGNGRYGLDSYRLKRKFNINVYPTDISENMLKYAKDNNIIKEYGVENIESLSFKDNSFDIIFCKEALHHLPRPIIGIYEMLRVASEAVILIEPIDEPFQTNVNIRKYFLTVIKALFWEILNKRRVIAYLPCKEDDYSVHINFEQSGNYVYGISNHEINKIVYALDLGGMAFYRFNIPYEEGVEFEKAEVNNNLFKQIKQSINNNNKSGNFNYSTTIIFKNKINSNLKSRMIESGFIFPFKKNNPIIK